MMQDTSQFTIVVVDDERHNIDLVRRALMSRKHYHVEGFALGPRALEFLGETVGDVLIVDYRMPEMDGITLLKKIVELGVSLPTIMATGFPDEPAIQKALVDGLIDKIIPKPWGGYEMLEAVDGLLANRM